MRTLTAFYDSRDHAEQARAQLLDAGLSADDVTISAASSGPAAGGTDHSGEGGFLQSVKNFFMPEEDRHAYDEGISRGGVLLTAHTPEGQEERVTHILDNSGAIDFDARRQEWQGAGQMGERDVERRDDPSVPASSRSLEADRDVTIPIAEERLAVGKRELDRGSVRVRSYVAEHPVHEQVNLREEHVNIERRPVNERLSGAADGVFEERSFEATERAEEPVVSKETVVTEELRLSKEQSQRTEDIQDTVRKTEVDVDDNRGQGQRNDGTSEARREV